MAAHWVALHETLGVGAPITIDVQYEQALVFVEQVFDAVVADPAHPLGGLVDLLADRIREFEDRVHPWPDAATPAHVLASLMQAHGLSQAQLPEVGSQSVVIDVLAGKRQPNARQVAAMCQRFAVPADLAALTG